MALLFDQAQPTEAAEELPLIDERVMADWRGDLDEVDVRDLLARVPGECDKCLVGVKEGLAKGDLAAVKRFAHRLKGMASNLGAARLARMARGIELACTDLTDVTVRAVELEKTIIATLEAIQPGA